ncbi:LOG family protein [Marinicauda salina]|uniref:LOG family protein n=1 Tax=Marinicauda salina TaxID=2135793 RepID=UPI001E565289|nr:TIGR00730 family Rossman fold protein [Marinicauda salina]
MAKLRSICIFCGSEPGDDPRYEAMADAAGRHIAESGVRLVYGGGEIGLMGVAARAAQAAGGEVLGVIPEFMIPAEGAQEEIELRKVATMGARKAILIEEADAFLILPGGTGTLESIFDLISRRREGHRAKPVVFADAEFWAPLKALLDKVAEEGFVIGDAFEGLSFEADLEDALDRLLGAD